MKSKYIALLLGWLVPGLGHYYAGKERKAAIFFVAIMASTIAGFVLGGFRSVYFQPDHYQFYAEVGNGLFTVGVSFFMQILHLRPIEATASAASLAGPVAIADLYLMVAGLLNMVVAANAFDVVAAQSRQAK